MEGGIITTDLTLDHIEFHLFPSQNRYEASVCSSNREENVASGQLELLMLHSPEINDLSSEGSNAQFKILPPENVNDAGWFTTATLKRFLHIIGLPDIFSVGKEICQLAETKNFQLSLSNKPEDEITTSIESKNELLLAVDLRLTALKEELAAAFNQAIGCKCSPKDFSDLRNFALHFGANDLKDSLYLLTEEDLALSSEEDEQFVERSQGLARSFTPRRSASPMRRVQIGRSGSRRAAAISIKSLNYLPAKEKSMSQRDATDNSSEEEDSQRLPKNNVLKMSVQDKISLFESKKRDEGVDIQKTKTTVGAEKSVLKRWSTGIGARNEVTSPSSPNNVAPIAITDPDNNTNKTETCAETSENMSFLPEKGALEHLRVEVNTLEHESEYNQQKGDELNELCQKLMESKPVRHQDMTSENSKNKKPKEQRGGFYDLYKKKKEEKLRGEASGEIIEKEAKMVFTKVSGANRRHAAVNEPQKTQQNSTQLINPKTARPSVKIITSKSSTLLAARKSWPSTPSPKAAQASPSFSPTGPTSTNSTPTNRNPHAAAKLEKSQPQLKTPKATQPDSCKRIKVINEKKQPTLTENKKITKNNVQSPKTDSTATTKRNFYNKVTRKNSVVPVETKPFLRKGSRMGTGVGPVVIKTKGVACKTKDNKVVATIDITSQNQENHCQPTENCASLDLEHEMVSLSSPTKYDESESGCHGSKTETSEINSTTEEELEISCSAWVVDEEPHQDEIVPCKESPINLSSPTNVTPPAVFSRPRVRHSLSQILFEESNEADIGVWGNAEHPPTMIYQKDGPRGLKRLLKFARKAKAESYLTGWSSPSAFSEGEEDAEESRGLLNFSRLNIQNHQRVPEGHVFASTNTTKATRSFFSLSAFRGNK